MTTTTDVDQYLHWFESPLQVTGATLQELTVLRCELPALLGNGIDVGRDLNLSESTVTRFSSGE